MLTAKSHDGSCLRVCFKNQELNRASRLDMSAIMVRSMMASLFSGLHS